ncbi:glycosyltransferase family 87 protein [Aliiroseovarius sp.]|uniref:glycosyltransferase family 87 protein n=1 Tax=Aliiroseovarius sp. TaxID=1872442 RepID=UPI003BAADF6C
MIRLRIGTLALILGVFAALAGYVAVEFAAPDRMDKAVLLDFDVFHLVGVLISEGNLRGAYDPAQFLERQAALAGFDGSQLFFSYPPPFAMLIAPLGALPAWAAYLLFMGGSMGLYLWALRRLAGQGFHTVLVLMLPLMLLILRAGQNSFLTGGLMALVVLGAVQARPRAGVPGGIALGLMAIKPHLAIGFALWAVGDRRWRLVITALLIVALFSALSTLVFGTQVWTWFLGSAAASSEALRAGIFPLFRMTSVYAFALSIGAPVLLATVLHLSVILSGLAALIWLRRIGASPRVVVGAGLYISALISPYNYDYDLAMLAGAAALFLDVIVQQARRGERAVLFVAVWGLSLYGMVMTLLAPQLSFTPPSIGGPTLVGIGVILLRLQRREAGLAPIALTLSTRRVRP